MTATPTYIRPQSRSAAKLSLAAGSTASWLLGVLGLVVLNTLPYRLSSRQDIALQWFSILTPASLLSAAILAWLLLAMIREAPGLWLKFLARTLMLLSCGGLLVFLIDPESSGVHSSTSPMNRCANQVRAIDSAKEEWALRNGATNGTPITWEQIANYFTNGPLRCPEGGRYELGRVGESTLCSIPSHRIPDPDKQIQFKK